MEFSFLHPTPMAAAVFIITLSILVFRVLARKSNSKTSNKRYPPKGGTLIKQVMNFNRIHDYMADIGRKHRTYRIIVPFRNKIFTSDPANVEYILKTNFENYGKGQNNYSILRDLLGDGIFVVDGERWREQRKLSSLEFSARALRDISSTIFKENAVKLAHIVSQAVTSNQPMDIQDLFMKTAMDSIFRVAFGVELDTMCGSNEEGSRFCRAFDDASEITGWRYIDVTWKIKKALNIGFEAKLKDNIRIVDEFIYKLIDRKMTQMEQVLDDHSKREDILTRFMKLSRGDPRYLRDIILNFVIAGKDTTATTLSWFFYMLCKNPLVQEKVAQEINQATALINRENSNTNISEFASSLTEEAIGKMHYLHAALTETLRLYPPVPVDPKICFSDDTLPDGFSVRKGDSVDYHPYTMGRMESLWGDDAGEFKPERFMDNNGRFKPESSFKFTAFQAGPRICLGKDFAYRQMKIFSALLLRFFIFKLSDENKLVKPRTMIILQLDGGLSIRASRRSDSAMLA